MPGIADFSFRIRFNRSPQDTINIEDSTWETKYRGLTLTLRTAQKNSPIKDAKTLVLRSCGWQTADQAQEAGNSCFHAIMRTLACLRIGADYGLRAPASFITDAGLRMLNEDSGHSVLRDIHGLMVFETTPSPRFVALGHPSIIRGTPRDRFERAFDAALAEPQPLSAKELISIQLFNAAFFQASPDSRFLLLIMAAEALMEFPPRSIEAVKMVDSFIAGVQQNGALSESERASMIGSLRWLRLESINQAGRRLAAERLPGRIYNNEPAPSFFSKCYDIRSRLVHAQDPLPSRADVGTAAAHMETFVSDLLAGHLLNKIWPIE